MSTTTIDAPADATAEQGVLTEEAAVPAAPRRRRSRAAAAPAAAPAADATTTDGSTATEEAPAEAAAPAAKPAAKKRTRKAAKPAPEPVPFEVTLNQLGVSRTIVLTTGATVRDFLEKAGLSAKNGSVIVNNEKATLDTVIPADAVVLFAAKVQGGSAS